MTLEQYTTTYREHHAQSLAIAAAMRATDDPAMSGRAKRMESCGTYVEGYVCPDCGEYHVARTSLCRDRLCPNCGWALTRKRGHAAMAALETVNAALPVAVSHVTLTLDHSRKSDLGALVCRLTQGYGAWVRDPRIDATTAGSLRSVEITYPGDHGFHPHIHALVAEPEDCARLDTDLCRAVWRDAAGLDYDPQVECSRAYATSPGDDSWQSACLEAVKYAIKPGWLATLPVDEMERAAAGLRGARLISSTGAIKAALRDGLATVGGSACSCHTGARPVARWLRWDHDVGAFEVSAGPSILYPTYTLSQSA